MSLKTRIKRIEAMVGPPAAAHVTYNEALLHLVEVLEPLVAPILGPRGDTHPFLYFRSMPEEFRAQVMQALQERARQIEERDRYKR